MTTAMILAAGFGKRMLPLTETTPKPLLTVNDKPLIVYHIEKLVSVGVRKIVINVSHLGEKIVDYLGDGSKYGAAIHFSVEAEPLETAGGLVKALPLLGDQPFICVNGDIWTELNFKQLKLAAEALALSDHSPESNASAPSPLAYLVLVDNPVHNPKGDFSLNQAQEPLITKQSLYNSGEQQGATLTDVQGCEWAAYPVREKSKTSADRLDLTFSGMSVLSPLMFDGCDERVGPLAPLLRKAMQSNQVIGSHYKGCWSDVGTPERLDEVNRLKPCS